jgi:hypothetical protein
MELLYKNRSEQDQEFIKYVCMDILSNPCKEKARSNLFCGIFIDGRNREINNMEDYACFHSFSTFSEYSYPIFAFVNNTNNFLDNNAFLIDKYNIKIIKINELNSLEAYSIFCIRELYFNIPQEIEHIITLQPDAMIIKEGYESYLLNKNFVYIGAPWLHSPAIEYLDKDNAWQPFFQPTSIGNGGMSYRRASFCRWASQNFARLILREKFAQDNKKPQEDLFFSVIANLVSDKPTRDEARIFSIDPLDKIDYNNKTSYAFHYFSAINPWK